MKLEFKLVGAALAAALVVPAALAIQAGYQGTPSWTITSGPTLGTTPFPEDGNHSTVSISGKIDPPLPSGITGRISKVERTKCDGSSARDAIDESCWLGGANGASFTFYLEQSCLGTHCKRVEVTYELTTGTETTVSFRNPRARNVAVVDFGSWMDLPPDTDVALNVNVIEMHGSIHTSYNGDVDVSVWSLSGSAVKVDGSFGTTVVTVADGTGSFTAKVVNAVEGDTIVFELTGNRLDPCRSSIDLQ